MIYEIPPNPSPIQRIVMAVVIVHQPQLSIIVLAAPLDGLPCVTTFRYFTIGGIGVACANIAVCAVDFADVFG